MTEKKTLKLKDPSENDGESGLNKRGRGWEISSKRLDGLHDRAREMRRHSSEAHKALAKRFSEADLGHYAFKRFPVIGSAIVDFGCHNIGMAITIIDGEVTALDKRRDASLKEVGIRIMRIKAEDILEDIDGVLERITTGMRMRIEDKKTRIRDNNSQPRREGPRRTSSRDNPYQRENESSDEGSGEGESPDSNPEAPNPETGNSSVLSAYSGEAPEAPVEEVATPEQAPEQTPERAPEDGNDDA